MRSRPALLSVLVAAALTASSGLVAAPASSTTTREARMLAKINHARANHGLRPLHSSPDLMRAARSHSRSMAGSRVLFHTSSFSSICCWEAIGENVGDGLTVRGVHREFMHSPPHRANVLARRMREVGVGVVSSGGRLWVTEIFRDRMR